MNKLLLEIILIVIIGFSVSICILYLNYFEVGYNFFDYVKHSLVYILSILISSFVLYRIK